MMKHQDPPAKTRSTDLEAGTIGGKRVRARLPRVPGQSRRVLILVVVRLRYSRIVIAIVEHCLEHPSGIGDLGVNLRLVKPARAVPGLVEKRRAVAEVD